MVIVMNKKGFTLIEVIMVIAIIAILSLILIPNVMVLIDKNKERSCEKMIDNIKRILVYTFIYEGVTNWKEAYATVTIKQTGGDDFIIHMDEFSATQKMFAISEIVNIGDAMSVEKKALFFHGHQDMDKAFNWGFKWTTGRK